VGSSLPNEIEVAIRPSPRNLQAMSRAQQRGREEMRSRSSAPQSLALRLARILLPAGFREPQPAKGRRRESVGSTCRAENSIRGLAVTVSRGEVPANPTRKIPAMACQSETSAARSFDALSPRQSDQLSNCPWPEAPGGWGDSKAAGRGGRGRSANNNGFLIRSFVEWGHTCPVQKLSTGPSFGAHFTAEHLISNAKTLHLAFQ
jgi:hypothetical protein